jgi:hypothetical protein
LGLKSFAIQKLNLKKIKTNNMQKSKSYLGLAILAIVMVTATSFATPPPVPSVPDASSSAFLLSLSFAGLAAVRKFVR